MCISVNFYETALVMISMCDCVSTVMDTIDCHKGHMGKECWKFEVFSHEF